MERTAQRAANAITKGKYAHHATRVRRSVHFFRPKSKKTVSSPMYPRRLIRPTAGFDAYSILIRPVATEHAMAAAEEANTITFMVAKKATKKTIKAAFKEVFDVVPVKVNTLITPLCEKKAYIRLPANVNAANFAAKNKLQ